LTGEDEGGGGCGWTQVWFFAGFLDNTIEGLTKRLPDYYEMVRIGLTLFNKIILGRQPKNLVSFCLALDPHSMLPIGKARNKI